MRITKVNIPQEGETYGLEAITMERMGQVVLLAGQNGAGKSRLLKVIEGTISNKPNLSQIKKCDNDIIRTNNNISRLNSRLEHYKGLLSEKKINKEITKKEISNIHEQIKEQRRILKDINDFLEWNLIETSRSLEKYQIVPFVPQSLNLRDSNELRKIEIAAHAKNLDLVGVNSLADGTISRIEVIQNKWFNATHQATKPDPHVLKEAVADYQKLKELIAVFLNTELKRTIDGEPELFGFPIGKANLSDGQKVLLQLCLAIHCQQSSLDELVLFMDEPENHLHPSVIIQTIEKIIECIPNGQVWISTHSLPVLSYFGTSNIWFVQNNKVSYAGSGPEKVLRSLLGDDERIGKLQDFIALPGVMALNQHAFECLFHPEVLMTDGKDPQVLQIKSEIEKHLKKSGKMRILDFGAGKGRLLANILETNRESISDFKKWFDYRAYDKFDADKKDCLKSISAYDENTQERYFNSSSELFAKCDKASFDVVVMCNVLHEIDPSDWLSLFSEGGLVYDALSDKGVVLIVEDQRMPIGEKAYQKGFIVLDTAELKELFEITEKDSGFDSSDARNDGRLKAHLLTKDLINRINPKSRINALKVLHNKASEEISNIRAADINYKNGRLHGFWVQQYANTGLALQELDK